jgi:hypothetical protein
MIEYNRNEFEIANILKYQNMPIKKDVGSIVVLDSNNRPRDNDNVNIVIDNFRNDDESGHNTRVCGVLREVVPDANIITFNWFGSEKEQIIDWIIDNKNEIAVINCSFSGTPDGLEQIMRLKDIGIPIVFASGNDYNENDINQEAELEFTIAIGAFKEYNMKVEDYSNGSPLLDAVAFTWLYESVTDTKYYWFNGTSGAAPTASGMLWLYMSRTGLNFTQNQAKQFVRHNTIDLYEEGHDNKSGCGLFILPDVNQINMFIGSSNYKLDGVNYIMDSMPILQNNRTFVPIRFVAEALGCNVTWGGDIEGGNRDEIIIKHNDVEVNLFIGDTSYYINGAHNMMDVEPFLDENNRTLVPIRFVAEALGANVVWGGDLPNGNRDEVIIKL